MKKYGVTCTMIYNGYKTVEAKNEEEAIEKVQQMLHHDTTDEFPNDGYFGSVFFNFGEATADYADETDFENDDEVVLDC